jgi:competence protein ComEC
VTIANRPWHIAIGAFAAGLALAPAGDQWAVASAALLAVMAAVVSSLRSRPLVTHAGSSRLGTRVAPLTGAASLGPVGPVAPVTGPAASRPLTPAVPVTGAASTGPVAPAAPVARAVPLTLAALLLLAGSAIGEARLRAIDAPASRVHDGESFAGTVHLLQHPRPSPFGSTAQVRVASGRLRGAHLLARLPPWLDLGEELPIGAELAVRARVRAIEARANAAGAASSGGSDFDFEAYLRRSGVAGELLVDLARPTGRRRGGVEGWLDDVRGRAERAVVAGMPTPEAALLRGMVLGEDEAITESVREDFQASGLAHILAVSGQNVMLLVALALPLMVAVGLGRQGRAVALLLLIALYVPLAGAGPSLQRAGVMGAAGIVATLASRPASRWYALLLAAAATLALNPRACGGPGWQLSFAAVAGILWLGDPLRRALRTGMSPLVGGGRAAAALGDGMALTLAATIATAPLLGHHFGAVPLAALPANLLALPAVAPAMWLGMLKAAVGQVPALLPPLAPAADALSGALGAAARVPVAWIAEVAERLADLPGGRLTLPLGRPVAVGGAYAVMAALVMATRRLARPLGPPAAELAARWRRQPLSRRAAPVAVLVAVLVLAGGATLAPPSPPTALTVRFLDVGQGDATLIQAPDGAAVLFDGGPPEAGVVDLLRRAGVRRLAVVVATHPSRDHHGGLREVLRSYHVDLLLDGGDGTRDPTFRAVLAEAARRGVRRVAAVPPLTLETGEITIRVLSPPPRPPGPPPEDPNPRGVVTIVSSGAFDLMLSADAESVALLPLALPDVDAMKVPHHGSSDDGLPRVLERLRPEVAAIEVGRHNTYGHPAPSTLAALRRAGVQTYRTDRDGTVTLTVEHGRMRVATER